MKLELPDLLDRFDGVNVAVVGEAMLDSYISGHAERLCREAPVPVVARSTRVNRPGGAANTAANLAALGASVRFLSVVGDDPEGWIVRRCLGDCGVAGDDLVLEPGRATLAKHRVVADGQILVRYDQGSTEPIAHATEEALVSRLQALASNCVAIVVSDYGYGVMTRAVVEALAHLQRDRPRLTVVDSRDLSRYRAAGVTVAKPNYGEAVRLLGQPELDGAPARVQQIASQASRLFDCTGAQLVAVTFDADGALVLDREAPPYRTYARRLARVHPAGAGDTYLSALTLALAAGAGAPQAAELAALAAGVVVAKDGTACCSAQELREALSAEQKVIVEHGRLAAQVARYREQGRRIVFTNGCFDILHRGHITYLNRAKALGAVLIVGLNSDASVRRLKGPGRPINSLEDRAQVLAALSSVDHIVPFDEDTPEALIRIVRPDLYVKGGDYTRETLPEAPAVEALGGTVQILPYMEDRSTTAIIERIRAAETQAAARGSGEAAI